MDARDEGIKVVATNRRARHEYDILDTYEAGLVLRGTEVKSLREGRVTISEAFAAAVGDVLVLKNADIAAYSHGNLQNHDPRRDRVLLLHRREIAKILARVNERGFTLVPLRLYFKGGRAKLEFAVARGRKLHDKREAKAKREAQREIERVTRKRR